MIRQMHQIIHPTEYQNSFHVFFLIGQQEIPDQEAELQLAKEKSKYGDIIDTSIRRKYAWIVYSHSHI